MKTKTKLFVAALLISSFATVASGPALLPEFSPNSEQFIAKRRSHDPFKLKYPAVLSRSNSSAGAGGDVQDGGLFVNVGVFLPSSSFMNPFYGFLPKLFKFGYDAEFGHYFKLLKVSKFSVGVRLTWLSAGYTSYSDINTVNCLYASPIRVGAQGMYAINEKMAVNLFYQLGANYTIILSDGKNYSYLGLTHEIGGGFQWRIFNIGLGYRLGNLKNIHNSNGSAKDDFSWSTNNFRIYLGLKF